MAVKILFSPVGYTDPMSETAPPSEGEAGSNESKDKRIVHDGSLLHIFRKEKPDYVYLYMTDDIFELSKADGRYCRALLLLADHLQMSGFSENNIEIIRSQVTGDDVINMDAFYDDYRRCIDMITEKFGEDINLIINISSGTPAMKAALYILKSIKNVPCQMFQVKDPDPQKKQKNAKSYPLDSLFSQNEDNNINPNITNRISSVAARNIRELQAADVIARFLNKYNYSGAKEAYESLVIRKKQDPKVKAMLSFAAERKKLTISNDSEYAKYELYKKLPNARSYQEYKGFECQAAEYFLRIDLYAHDKEYTDMARSLTPFNTSLLCHLFYKLTQIYLPDYINPATYQFIETPGSAFRKFPKVNWKDYSRNIISPVKIINLLDDMNAYHSSRLKTCFNIISRAEKDLRNHVAHEMDALTEEKVKKVAEPYEIIDAEKVLLEECGVVMNSEWNTYDLMNEDILKELNRDY